MTFPHFQIHDRTTDRLYFVTSGDLAISVTPSCHVEVCSDADLLTMRCAPLSDLEDNPVAMAACRAAVAFAKAQALAIDPNDAFYD
jgi:hypothetical protein